ncbi:hypothetical protein D3C81_1545400 [compost metagenome]
MQLLALCRRQPVEAVLAAPRKVYRLADQGDECLLDGFDSHFAERPCLRSGAFKAQGTRQGLGRYFKIRLMGVQQYHRKVQQQIGNGSWPVEIAALLQRHQVMLQRR